MKKVKWKNLVKLFILDLCIISMISDFIILTFTMNGFSWFGVITFIWCMIIADYFIEDFKNQNKKSIHSYQPKHAVNTYERK